MELTKQKTDSILRAINKALAEVASEHGLQSLGQKGAATYDPTAGRFTLKIQGTIVGGLTDEESRYDRHREECDFFWQMPARGTAFSDRSGKRFIVKGMTRGGKYTLEDLQGKSFTMKELAFRRYFPTRSGEFIVKPVEA